MFLGLIVSVPLGWLATTRRPPQRVITVTGLLYTVPSLALFVMLPPVLGTRILDPLNVVVALTIYTVALLVRSVADALDAVPRVVIEPRPRWGTPSCAGSSRSSCRWRSR